jgi:hypothetical protein
MPNGPERRRDNELRVIIEEYEREATTKLEQAAKTRSQSERERLTRLATTYSDLASVLKTSLRS